MQHLYKLLFSVSFVFVFFLATTQANAKEREIQQTVNQVINALDSTYLYPDKAQLAIKKLTQKKRLNRWTAPNFDHQQFRYELRQLLRETTGDNYIDITQQTIELGTQNLNTNKIEANISSNNVGYLKLTGNFTLTSSLKEVTRALSQLSNSQALIIDIREAEQVNMPLIQNLLSYFIEPNTLIGNIHTNSGLLPLMTSSDIAHNQFQQGIPLYVMNSSFVSGAWEFFGFTLKQFDKAKFVGENTMGVDHFIKSVPIGQSLVLQLSFAKINHPVSKSTWHYGVEADYFVQGKEMINMAYKLANKSRVKAHQGNPIVQ